MNSAIPTRAHAVSAGILPVIFAGLLLTGCTITPGLRNNLDRGTESVPGLEVVEVTPAVVLAENQLNASAPSVLPITDAAAANNPYDYLLGPGDIVHVIVWDHPELTNPAGQAQSDPATTGRLVAPDGTMFFPYVGTFQASGKTVSEIRDLLGKRLSKYIVNAQVDARVVSFRSQRVYVTGEVTNPGVIFLNDTSKSVVEALAAAGGLTPLADRSHVRLVRRGKSYDLDLEAFFSGGDSSPNLVVQAGDQLHVADVADNKIFLMGEFASPKTLLQQRRKLSLADALSEGGGLDKTGAKASALFVFRRKPGAVAGSLPKVYVVDMNRAESLLLAEQFPLEPRDVVYVAATEFSKYNRVLNQLLPTISAIFQIKALVNSGR